MSYAPSSDTNLDDVNTSFISRTSQSSHDVLEPPAILPRLSSNPDFVRYTERQDDTFNTWWNTTPHAAQIRNSPTEYRHPNWHSKKSSSVWTSYEQVANAKTGLPKAACRRCGRLLLHPATKNTGTSNLQYHIKHSQCSARGGIEDQTDTSSINVSASAYVTIVRNDHVLHTASYSQIPHI